MPGEKDTVYSTKIKYRGIFNFSDFYKFCYDWLTQETSLSEVNEKKYVEKVSGDSKDIEVEWEGNKKLTDYFKFEISVKMKIQGLKKVEVNEDGKKRETNKGEVEMTVKGTIVKDYQGKFETSASAKFIRGVYERWIIPARINEIENKITSNCETFVTEAKAYLDLMGKK